ncbi:unnamed protein product [Cyclocybe aegerita]|uniref:Uncharacterized protein n=1 Tax=Cyclocybe aegerita TaxID=1973307 RepID=A0A8S0XLS9_CYCAE|nr:unnamed protein product [Cyclocybe aegerita]
MLWSRPGVARTVSRASYISQSILGPKSTTVLPLTLSSHSECILYYVSYYSNMDNASKQWVIFEIAHHRALIRQAKVARGYRRGHLYPLPKHQASTQSISDSRSLDKMPKLIEIRDLVKTGLRGLSFRRRESSPSHRQRRLGFRKLFGSRTSQRNEALYDDDGGVSGVPRGDDIPTLSIDVETDEESLVGTFGLEAISPSNVMVYAGDIGGPESSFSSRPGGLLGYPIPLPHVDDERFPIDIESVCGDSNHAGASTFDGSFDGERVVPAGSTLFDTHVVSPVPVRSSGWTIPLPDVDDEPYASSHENRQYIRTDIVHGNADISDPLRLRVNDPAISSGDASLPISSLVEDGSHGLDPGDDPREQWTSPNDPSFWPLPTEILQICDTRPHISGCPWRDLELGNRWSNQTTLSLLCPLLVQQARRLLLHGKSTLVDVTFGQLYEDPAQLPPIRRGASLIKLDHLESLSITSSTHLGFLFDKTVVRLPKLKRLSLTSHRGRSGLSAPAVLDHALDVPWGNLKRLSLANESSSPCDILLILSKCDNLRQFCWSDDMEHFPASGRLPASKLFHLEELNISSSSEGCDALMNCFPKETVLNLRKGSFTSLPLTLQQSGDLAQSQLTHIAVQDAIPLENLLVILKGLKSLQDGKFAISDLQSLNVASSYSHLQCRSLRSLELSTTRSLRPLWSRIVSRDISTIVLSTRNHHLNLAEDIQPFLLYCDKAYNSTHTPDYWTYTWNFLS